MMNNETTAIIPMVPSAGPLAGIAALAEEFSKASRLTRYLEQTYILLKSPS